MRWTPPRHAARFAALERSWWCDTPNHWPWWPQPYLWPQLSVPDELGSWSVHS